MALTKLGHSGDRGAGQKAGRFGLDLRESGPWSALVSGSSGAESILVLEDEKDARERRAGNLPRGLPGRNGAVAARCPCGGAPEPSGPRVAGGHADRKGRGIRRVAGPRCRSRGLHREAVPDAASVHAWNRLLSNIDGSLNTGYSSSKRRVQLDAGTVREHGLHGDGAPRSWRAVAVFFERTTQSRRWCVNVLSMSLIVAAF